jgi:hypothetical protein
LENQISSIIRIGVPKLIKGPAYKPKQKKKQIKRIQKPASQKHFIPDLSKLRFNKDQAPKIFPKKKANQRRSKSKHHIPSGAHHHQKNFQRGKTYHDSMFYRSAMNLPEDNPLEININERSCVDFRRRSEKPRTNCVSFAEQAPPLMLMGGLRAEASFFGVRRHQPHPLSLTQRGAHRRDTIAGRR